MKPRPFFFHAERNGGTDAVKTVVTIGSEAVPRGAERVEQNPERLSLRSSRQIVRSGSVPRSVPRGTPRKPLRGLAVPQFRDSRRINVKETEKPIRYRTGQTRRTEPVTSRPTARRAPRSAVRGNDPRTGEKPPKTPASRLVAGQERRRFRGERKRQSDGGKTAVFLRISGEFHRIYFQAGISAAVTSARNGGLRSPKRASLRGFGGS